MRVINIIDRADQINFGIWNAALSTAAWLKDKHKVPSEIWYPEENAVIPDGPYVRKPLPAGKSMSWELFDAAHDLLITHGCWRFPTRWANKAKREGLTWVSVPHGMLEPWSMREKRWKKLLYFHLLERRLLRKADGIRAVSLPEQKHLQQLFPQREVQLIPNGIEGRASIPTKHTGKRSILFMSRLHHKKGVLPLVQAWLKSSLRVHPQYELILAGPDQGEGEKISTLLAATSSNITIVGPKYGKEKEQLLERSHFFILPSYSEGFPTAALEGINYGLFPLISQGCNFPELLKAGHGWLAEPNVEQLTKLLNRLPELSEKELQSKVIAAHAFLQEHYTLEKIADQQYNWYSSLIENKAS